MRTCELANVSTSTLRRSLPMWLGLVIAVLMTHTALAQTFSASIAGTVTDSSGAVVRGAKLEIQNNDTRDIRVQTSADNGAYS